MKVIGYIVLLIVCAIVGMFILGSMLPQKTYKEMAADWKQDCLDNNGYGQWAGHMGSLDQFCQMYGLLKANDLAKQEHPENY